MRLEHISLSTFKKHILTAIQKHLDLSKDNYQLFFFGSRVTGKGDEKSDIDIGIEGPCEIPSAIMSQIKEEIENLPILYKIELVDFKKVSPEFKKIALKKIENFL